MRRQLGALFLSCTLFTGCYTTHRFPAAPIPVRLAAPSGFRLVQPATIDAPASTCAVLRAEVEVAALRGDTLHFARVAVLQQPQDAGPCAHSGAGFVVLADHPELRAERYAVNGALTWSAIIVALPIALFVLLYLGCSTILGCYDT